MLILLTAPTGNVGAQVVKRMIEGQTQPDALPFRIGAHNPDKLRRQYGDDSPVMPFDFSDRSTWDAVLDGIDRVFLVYPLPQPRTIRTWMTPFIDELARRKIVHLVYLDVPSAKDQRIVPHYHVERHIEASGIPYTFLRASYFMQNLCRGLSTHGVDIADHDEIFVPAGDGKITFLDARDVAEVAINILRDPEPHRNQAYTLAGPENLDMTTTARIFTDVFGRPIRYADPNTLAFVWRMFRRHVKWDVILFMTLVYGVTRGGKSSDFSPDLERLLGRPPTTMRQFVTEEKWRWDTRTWT